MLVLVKKPKFRFLPWTTQSQLLLFSPFSSRSRRRDELTACTICLLPPTSRTWVFTVLPWSVCLLQQAAFLELLFPPPGTQMCRQPWLASPRLASTPAQAPSKLCTSAHSLGGDPITSLVYSNTYETAPECEGWTSSSHGPSTPPSPPVLSRHRPLLFPSKLPPVITSPVTQRGQVIKHWGSKEENIQRILPFLTCSQLLPANVKKLSTPCCSSQALCICSLISLWEMRGFAPSDRFQAVVSSLKRYPWDTVLPDAPKSRHYQCQGAKQSYGLLSCQQAEAEEHSLRVSPPAVFSSQSPRTKLGLGTRK